MADGVTHYTYLQKGWVFIILLGIIITVSAYLLGSSHFYLYGIFIPFNFHLCRYFDADDDQPGLTSTEGRIMRESKTIYMGFFGTLIVSYKFIYSYIAGLFGGHRSWFSHGIGIKGFKVISTGTFGRIIFYNIPVLISLNALYGYAVQFWNWSTAISMWKSFYMDIWFIPYIISQIISWSIGDTIHLFLDTDWFKNINAS